MIGLSILPPTPEVKERIKEAVKDGCFEMPKVGATQEMEVCICPRCGHLGMYTLEPGCHYEHGIWYDHTTKLWQCWG